MRGILILKRGFRIGDGHRPPTGKLCINGHEYLNQQLARRGIAFEALDNGLLRCANPAAAQRLAEGFDQAKIDRFFRKLLCAVPHPFPAADRKAGYRYRLSILQAPGTPEWATVWLLVVSVAAFGCFTSAYGSGAQGARSNFTSFFLPILLAIVIVMIFDIDHSLQGVIGVSQQPMIDLKASITE